MQTLLDRWWLVALRGVAALGFGALCLTGRVDTTLALVLLFGTYAFVDGFCSLVLALRGAERGDPWGSFFFGSLSSVLAGVVAFLWPEPSGRALLSIIAAWAVMTGVAAIAAAIRVRKEIEGEWLLVVAGACSVVFGLLLHFLHGPEPLQRVGWMGTYALVMGVLLVAFGLRLRAFGHHAQPPARPRQLSPEPA